VSEEKNIPAFYRNSASDASRSKKQKCLWYSYICYI
jgi:hypothetical protein